VKGTELVIVSMTRCDVRSDVELSPAEAKVGQNLSEPRVAFRSAPVPKLPERTFLPSGRISITDRHMLELSRSVRAAVAVLAKGHARVHSW